jgi:hyperosmotically inducible periplasmic protein
MFRGLLRLVLLIVVIVGATAFLLGWWGGRVRPVDEPAQVVGTTGTETREKARAVGAEVGEKTAVAADRAEDVAQKAGAKAAQAAEQTRRAIAEGSVTAKIKAKMALDEFVKARDLDVDTVGSIVTVSGWVHSQAEKDRALQLARETQGVTQVVDKVQIK